MNQEALAAFPLWMMIAASLGFVAGWTCADQVRRRKQAEAELSEPLQQLVTEVRAIHRTLRQQRGAINDLHKHFVPPVPKGSSKPGA